MPNHPANSFYYPRLQELPPIASIKLTRQNRAPVRQTPMSNHILPNSISPQRFSGKAARPSMQIQTILVSTYICLYNVLTYLPLFPPSTHLPLCISIFFIHPRPSSPHQRHHWTVRCHSGHRGVCVWAPAPGAVSATVPATSSWGRLMLAPPALSLRNRPSAHHTTVWNASSPWEHTTTDIASMQHWDYHLITDGLRRCHCSLNIPLIMQGVFVWFCHILIADI